MAELALATGHLLKRCGGEKRDLRLRMMQAERGEWSHRQDEIAQRAVFDNENFFAGAAQRLLATGCSLARTSR